MTFTVLQSVYKKDNPEFLAQSLQSIAEIPTRTFVIDLLSRAITGLSHPICGEQFLSA